MGGIPYIKTKIGEHDYDENSCVCAHDKCHYMRDFCPLLNVKKIDEAKVSTWQTVAKDRLRPKHVKTDDGVVETKPVNPMAFDVSCNVHSISELDAFSDISQLEKDQIGYELGFGLYTCWGDGSGYEYDQMSLNVIGPGGPLEQVYDISSYGIGHNPLTYSEWNAWVDKFQYDYRYGRVSDTNAECVLFPNVDNPWMMTEYVYRGVGGENSDGKVALQIPDEYVVEPPLYDPDTLKLVNGDFEKTVSSTRSSKLDWEWMNVWKDKYQLLYEHDTEKKHRMEKDETGNWIEWDEHTANVRFFRRIDSWEKLVKFTQGEIDDINNDGRPDDEKISDFDDSGSTGLPVKDAGVRLYRARIPVQSVKWGEHGNIPSHALDMMAPADWLDPTASVSKIRARYVAHVGTPFYANRDGIITWNGSQAYIEDFGKMTAMSGPAGRRRYSYSVTGNGDAVPMPYKWEYAKERILKPYEKVMGVAGTDNVCHGGCALCSGAGNPSGILKCSYIEGLSDSDAGAISAGNSFFDSSKCLDSDDDGHGCPHYVKSRRHPLIATYQVNVMQRNQLASNIANVMKAGMAMAAIGGIGGVMVATGTVAYGMSAELDLMYQQYKNLSNYKDANITYELKYEVVHASPQVARLNKKKYNEFGKNVQIVPGTGKYAFDSEKDANPFSGGDTNVYNDISTLSFGRFFRSVMPCAKQAHCHAFAGIDQADGWQAGVKAGGNGKCRYYCDDNGMGCPYNGASKRAIEFGETAVGVYDVISVLWSSYENLTELGCWRFTAGHVFNETSKRYRKWKVDKDDKDSPVWLIVDDEWAIMQKSDDIAIVALKVSDNDVTENIDCSEKIAGAAMLAGELGFPKGYAKAFEFRTKKSNKKILNKPWYKSADDGDYDEVNVDVYKVLDAFYWFQPLYNNGSAVTANKKQNENDTAKYSPYLEQHVDSNGYWFCKAERGFPIPEHNCIMVDNEDKFIGGWHPEYKDYSRIGTEFMQDIVSDASREGQAMGDYVQNGDYTPIPQTVNKKGYWIDQSGEYITDEREIGWDVPIAGNDDRESNSGVAPCISFHKTNSTMDMDTGKKRQPKVDHGAVFANDPYQLVVKDYKGKRPEFEDPDTNNKYVASCYINFGGMMLPTMRHALHCTKCDYYIHIRYISCKEEKNENGIANADSVSNDSKCPWCGSNLVIIHGDTGDGFGDDDSSQFAAEGKTWKDDLPEASVIKKFFKIYSLGMADVWAPPGTSIPTDAYFWRHQAIITNATKRQIYHRLGTKGSSTANKQTGGGKVGFLFDKMTRTGELTMGYQEGLGAFIPVPKGRYVKSSDDGSSSSSGDVSDDEQTWIETSADTETTERYGKSYIKWNEGDSADVVGMYNPIMPRHMIPALYPGYDGGLEDEGVIAPYTTSSNDALKILSLDQIRVIRNAIEPMYAYMSEEPWNGEYPTMRASYDQREMQDQPIIFQGRRAMIRPIVLAKTDDNRDSFQAYYSGDLVYGNVREYFPSGYTWWFMKQLLGGRVTTHLGGRFHMDDNKFADNPSLGQVIGGSGGEYTVGNKTYAKCAISIYGMLPLDKEIVKAYVIVEPSGVDPSKNPVGRSWTGGPAMYYHYHAKTVTHFQDGKEQHLHGTAGYPNEEYFDENGKHVSPHGPNWYAPAYQDESAYRMWGAQSHSIDDDRFCYYEETFSRTMVNLPGLFDTSFYKNMGTPKQAVMDKSGEIELGVGYSGTSFPENDGFTRYNFKTDRKRDSRYQYLVVDADGNLVLKYPEAEVWKTKTAEEIQEVIDLNTCEVEFSASDGTEEGTVSYTFTETDAEVYQDEIPDQSQAISGYFDMGWTNSRGYVTGKYRIDAGNGESMWNAPVIFQDSFSITDGDGGYKGGGDNGHNSGKTARVLDVTTPIKKMYGEDGRIERTFGVDAGKSISELSKWVFYSPVLEDVDGIDDDLSGQNSMTQLSVPGDGSTSAFLYEISLLHSGSYPKLENVNDIPEISEEGDKYELADKEATVIASFSLPLTVTSENNRFGTLPQQRLNEGTCSTTDEVLDLLKIIFDGCEFEKISSRKIRVKSDKVISVPALESGSCYSLFGIDEGVNYYAFRDRTIECSSSLPGYEPVKLMNGDGGSWRYGVMTDAFQSFSVDLLRAPLLMKERGWRYSAGDNDNPPDGIKTYFYDKPFSENCLISRIDFKPSLASSYQCKSYSILAKRSGDDSWVRLMGFEKTGVNSYVDDKGSSYTVSSDSSFSVRLSGINNYRFVKVVCDSNEDEVPYQFFVDHYEGVDSDGNRITSAGYEAIVTMDGGFDDFVNISLAGLKASVGDLDPDHSDKTIRIVAAQVIGENYDRMRIFMDKRLEEDEDGEPVYIKVNVRKYFGGVDCLNIYGIPYKTEAGDDSQNQSGSGSQCLTITDGYDVYQASTANFIRSFDLPFTPCEIAGVYLDSGMGVKLTESDSTDIRWTTEDKLVNVLDSDTGEYVVKTVKKIVSGTYYYDAVRRTVYIPQMNKDDVSWTNFELEVEDYPTFKSYLPSSVTILYTAGSGKSITLPAVANGVGPSFMVEKGAINEIVSSSCNLTATGRRSCKILNPNATGASDIGNSRIESIPFVCSNNLPATLTIDDASRSNSKQGTVKFNAGEFRLPAFTGKELVGKPNNDQVFIDLFGDCACNCRGKCSTEVTFTGPANYVISGHVTVRAPKKTTRTMKVGGQEVKYEELTGGIKQGFLIVKCTPSSIVAGRMTKCYSLPKLLIYAKERNPYT